MNLLDLVARLSFEDTDFEQGVSNVERRVTTMGGVISKVVMAGGILKLGKDALKVLLAYDYPGNIRELVSIIERAAILSESEEISKSDLGI